MSSNLKIAHFRNLEEIGSMIEFALPEMSAQRIAKLVEYASKEWKVPWKDVISTARGNRQVAQCRHACWWLIAQSETSRHIAASLFRREYDTMCSGIRRATKLIQTDMIFAERVLRLLLKLKETES
jgi:hypothetical protein